MDNIIRSEGTLELTIGYEGPFATTDVEFYADPTGTRAFYLSGKVETSTNHYRGIEIDFPNDALPGEHDIPQPWPRAFRLHYFRQEGSHRQSIAAHSGKLNLISNENGKYHAVGSFHFLANVDGDERSFEGSFNIRLKQNRVSAEISDNPDLFVGDYINQDNHSDEKRNITWARTRSGDRELRIYIDKDIALGTHDIAMDKKVSVHYIAAQPGGGQWTFYANSGKFVVTRRDSGVLDATFNCEAPGKPEEEAIEFVNGQVEILDFKQ